MCSMPSPSMGTCTGIGTTATARKTLPALWDGIPTQATGLARAGRSRSPLSATDEFGAVGGGGHESGVGGPGVGVQGRGGQVDDVLVAVLGGVGHEVGSGLGPA